MSKSYSSIKAGWTNPNIDSTTGESKRKKKNFNEIKASDYDFGVDDNYINSFYNDYQNYVKSSESSYKNAGYKNISALFDNDTASREGLDDRASTIRAYINSRRQNIPQEKYNSLISALDTFNDYSSSMGRYFKEKKDYFSQWKTEDEYNIFANTQKYRDYSYDDIQKEIANKQKNGADEKEVNWLKNFAVSKNYATSDDYSKALDGANSRISELKTQKKEYELERRRAYKYNSKGTQNKLAEYDKQIKQAKKDRDALESGKELKRRDDIIQGEMSVQNNADFSDVSANRELNNPSRDELKKYDMRIDTGTWYTDGTGDYYNSLGEKIGKDTGEYLESHKNNGINDKLGLYLSAYNSEYDLKEAAALAGYNDTWADTVTEGVNGYWQELSENEKAVYYYYLNKGERDKAYKFLDDMGYQLGLRANEKEKAELEGANALLLIAANAASVTCQRVRWYCRVCERYG